MIPKLVNMKLALLLLGSATCFLTSLPSPVLSDTLYNTWPLATTTLVALDTPSTTLSYSSPLDTLVQTTSIVFHLVNVTAVHNATKTSKSIKQETESDAVSSNIPIFKISSANAGHAAVSLIILVNLF